MNFNLLHLMFQFLLMDVTGNDPGREPMCSVPGHPTLLCNYPRHPDFPKFSHPQLNPSEPICTIPAHPHERCNVAGHPQYPLFMSGKHWKWELALNLSLSSMKSSELQQEPILVLSLCAAFRDIRRCCATIRAIRISPSSRIRSWRRRSPCARFRPIRTIAATFRVIRNIPTSCATTNRRRSRSATWRTIRSACATSNSIPTIRNWWGPTTRKRRPTVSYPAIRNCW